MLVVMRRIRRFSLAIYKAFCKLLPNIVEQSRVLQFLRPTADSAISGDTVMADCETVVRIVLVNEIQSVSAIEKLLHTERLKTVRIDQRNVVMRKR